jgi:hypothetical protein
MRPMLGVLSVALLLAAGITAVLGADDISGAIDDVSWGIPVLAAIAWFVWPKRKSKTHYTLTD